MSQLLLHNDQPARALELLSLIVHHPRSDQEAKDHAQHLLTGMQHTFADNVHRTAWENSKSMDMKTILWDLLNVLDPVD